MDFGYQLEMWATGVNSFGIDNWKVTVEAGLSAQSSPSNIQITEHPLPSSDSENQSFGSGPAGITVGPASLTYPDGPDALWVTLGTVNSIAGFSTDGQQQSELVDPLGGGGFVVPSASQPEEIKTSLDGRSLWFDLKAGVGATGEGENSLVELNFQGFIDENVPQAGDWTDFTVGPDGNIWGADGFSIDRVTPGPAPSTSYSFTSPGSTVASVTSFFTGVDVEAITTGNDGNLWFTDSAGGIGRITPDGTVTLYPAPVPGQGGPITAGPDGNIWFVEESPITSQIVEMAYPPTAYVVTRTDDAMVPGTDLPEPGTLRYVIEHSDMIPGPNAITFDLPGSGPQTISLQSPLPAITTPVTIDGGTLGSVIINGSGIAGPGLVLDASGNVIEDLEITGFGGDGTDVYSAGNTIEDDLISGNGGQGLLLNGTGASGNLIEGNVIGTNLAGTAALGNGWRGIMINGGASDNTIGGTSPAARNIISGNGQNGIGIADPGTNANVVEGDYIGTDVTGSVGLGNAWQGVTIWNNAQGNTIGGTAAGAGNVIDDDGGGIWITGASGDVIQGNTIGLNAAGTAAIANLGDGIDIDGTGDAIGGTGTGARNVISGNEYAGVSLGSDGGSTLVERNLIGTAADGSAAVPNGAAGLDVYGSDNTIGGSVAGSGNVVSGNDHEGILIDGSAAHGNLLQGNLVGTDAAGSAAIGNGYAGLSLGDGAAANTVGGTAAAARNVFSANGVAGVFFFGSGTIGNLVEGNFIGTDASGSAALANRYDGVEFYSTGNTLGGTAAGAANVISGNGYDGIYIDPSGGSEAVRGNLVGLNADGSAALANGANGLNVAGSGNTIGGTAAGSGNTISGNGQDGVILQGTGASGNLLAGNRIGTDATGTAPVANGGLAGVMIDDADGNTINGIAAGNLISGNVGNGIQLDPTDVFNPHAADNLIQGNRIGVDATGDAPLGNGGDGIFTWYATNNTVGGAAAGAGNIIAANRYFGIEIDASNENLVAGNLVGVMADGGAAGNGDGGVRLGDDSGNTIGGTAAGAGDVISGNASDGLQIDGPGATGNLVAGNLIGTNTAGTAALVNGGDGVLIGDGANANTIGGTAAGAGNVISGNSRNGVEISGSGTSENIVLGNFIGLAAGGASAVGNAIQGVAINAGATGNTIGGTAAAANAIAGNGTAATGSPYYTNVDIQDPGTSGNLVAGNFIGTNADGSAGLDAPYNLGAVIGYGATSNTIGGTAAGEGNVISGNTAEGVQLLGAGTTGDIVEGNFIGTNAAGTAALANSDDGIDVDAPGNTIAGNVISGNKGWGISLFSDGGSTLVEGNRIGTNADGSAAVANVNGGIEVYGGDNTIGGTAAGTRNLISGDGGIFSVFIDGAGATGNRLEGNFIGTNADGTTPLANRYGIGVYGPGNTIGGTAAGAGNVISGNTYVGIEVGPGVASTLIQGDFIGTDATGSAAVPNLDVGIVTDGVNDTIGGTAAGAGNVISGNGGWGVVIDGSGNLFEGNDVGTNADGSAAVANDYVGIEIDSANNTIGGTMTGSGNLISGNADDGILINGVGNLLEGNRMGTNAAGTAAVPNQDAIVVGAGGEDTIGGTAAGAGNLLSGNSFEGIYIAAGVGSILIEGNFIGTNAAGSAAVPDGQDGIDSHGQGGTIGGTTGGAGNLISGNVDEGIYLSPESGAFVIQGNVIGINLAQTAAIPNADGIDVNGGSMTIGGTAAGAANVISGNTDDGIALLGTAGLSLVQGNDIGTDSTGTVALGNGADGIDDSSPGNTIGGTAAGAGNTISANAVDAISLAGANNLVEGNVIGTDAAGSALGNGDDGVSIASAGNAIGGTAAGAANIVADNGGAGVVVSGASSVDNPILSNSIYGNAASGILLNGGGNNNQPAPNLLAAPPGGTAGQVTVVVSLRATAGTWYLVQFFSNPTSDAQGETLVGGTMVFTNPGGRATFRVPLPAGGYVTATATDPNGNTSEFSGALHAAGAGVPGQGRAAAGPASPVLTDPATGGIAPAAPGSSDSLGPIDRAFSDPTPAITLASAGVTAEGILGLTVDVGIPASERSNAIPVRLRTSKPARLIGDAPVPSSGGLE